MDFSTGRYQTKYTSTNTKATKVPIPKISSKPCRMLSDVFFLRRRYVSKSNFFLLIFLI